MDVRPCVFFVGFRGDEFWSAVRVWGRPDFVCRGWDRRAQREVAENDVVVFARGEFDQPFSQFNFNDLDESAYDE